MRDNRTNATYRAYHESRITNHASRITHHVSFFIH
jgi:hypothetical protein